MWLETPLSAKLRPCLRSLSCKVLRGMPKASATLRSELCERASSAAIRVFSKFSTCSLRPPLTTASGAAVVINGRSQEAVQRALVVPTSGFTVADGECCTQALLDRHEKSHLHLTTASLLADAARQAAGNELLFRAVHHVTAALDSIQPAPQRQMFRELSLLAARRAKRA